MPLHVVLPALLVFTADSISSAMSCGSLVSLLPLYFIQCDRIFFVFVLLVAGVFCCLRVRFSAFCLPHGTLQGGIFPEPPYVIPIQIFAPFLEPLSTFKTSLHPPQSTTTLSTPPTPTTFPLPQPTLSLCL